MFPWKNDLQHTSHVSAFFQKLTAAEKMLTRFAQCVAFSFSTLCCLLKQVFKNILLHKKVFVRENISFLRELNFVSFLGQLFRQIYLSLSLLQFLSSFIQDFFSESFQVAAWASASNYSLLAVKNFSPWEPMRSSKSPQWAKRFLWWILETDTIFL